MSKDKAMRVKNVILIILLIMLLCSFYVIVLSNDESKKYLKTLRNEFSSLISQYEETLLDAGSYGPLYLFAIYLVTTVFMLPLWGFHVTTGYAYGTFWAALLISTTQAVCAGAAFATSRYVARPYIRDFLRTRYGNKFDAIDRAVSKKGLQTTILLRLSPIIPFGVNNYLCGCTGIKLWQWVLGTWIGVLPGTTAYCNVGALGKSFSGETTNLQKAVLVLQITAGLGAVYYLNRLATRALAEEGIGEDKDLNDKKS